jgi:ribosomal protein S18 acetylase RimI-like enzyme
MELRKIIATTLRKSLNEQQILNENNDRYILLPYDDEYNEDFEEYGIDEYDAADSALEIAKNGGVTILRDKRLSGILLDTKLSKVIGAIWVSNSSDKFSFDIAIDSSYQNMGLSDILIKAAINEYHMQKDIYDDMGEDFKMEVDVINPKLAKILKNKYGFYVVGELSQNRVLMTVG